MSVSLLTSKLFSRIKLPAQDLEQFSFCPAATPAAIEIWASGLPATRINHTSVVLYKILPELSRIKVDPSTRLAMLENLRPYVQRCIQGLAQSFLNKPVVLPDDAMKAAIVAMALQRHLSNGYTLAARDLALAIESPDPENEATQSLCAACHRAIAGLGIQLMRSYQLYASTPNGVWLTLHSLFRIAVKADIKDLMVEDELLNHERHTSISHSYNRVLLLASAGPNKMRQFDISTTYKLIEYWASLLVLLPAGKSPNGIHAIDLQSDAGPVPRAMISKESQPGSLELDVSKLLRLLDQHISKTAPPEAKLPMGTPATLLEFLRDSWGEEFHRINKRENFKHQLDVLVGMTSIHFHLCKGMPFENFILSSDKANIGKQQNRYLDKTNPLPIAQVDDPWNSAFDAGGAGRNLDAIDFSTLDIEIQLAARERDDQLDKFPISCIESEDRSDSGYCLKWSGNVPKSLRSGELMAVRESAAKDWSLALIRWVKQDKGSSHFGVEVITTNNSPLAISMIRKDNNDEDYMRGFLIAGNQASLQKSSVLIPSMPFQQGSKVRLNQRGHSRVAQLGRKIMSTGSISQFEYRILEA